MSASPGVRSNPEWSDALAGRFAQALYDVEIIRDWWTNPILLNPEYDAYRRQMASDLEKEDGKATTHRGIRMAEDGERFTDDEAGVTWDTFVELGKPAGVPVFPGAAGAHSKGYVCSSYVLGDPFLMPGNRVGRCAICGHPIQMRPHAPEAIRKVCLPCALLNGLKMPVISKKPRRPPAA